MLFTQGVALTFIHNWIVLLPLPPDDLPRVEGDITDEFASADLNDVRRTRRLCKVAAAMASAPSLSLSAASGGWAETIATYRLLNQPDITPELLLAPHREATLTRCAAQACVVVAQDTTELDFSRMKSTEGLGPLNTENRRGLFMHSLHAVSESGLPLGMVSATMMIRDAGDFRGTARRKASPITAKESRRWVEGYLESCSVARRLPQCEVVSVSDREGDIFEVFEAWHQAEGDVRAEWIIRANQDRALSPALHEDGVRLFQTLSSAPLLGGIEFDLTPSQGWRKVKGNSVPTHRTARQVRQEIRAMEITPRPPYRKGSTLPEVSFWAVLAEEKSAPDGEEPVRWLLLTSKPVATLEEAKRILRLYMRRWDIEVFHRVLKTGCRVEQIQLRTAKALVNALAIHAVIAWRILYLTHLGRHVPEMPCGEVFGEAEWKSACAVVGRRGDEEPALAEFIAIVGKLGGHLGRNGDGPPGAQSIWQGLARVRDFACAWLAIHGS